MPSPQSPTGRAAGAFVMPPDPGSAVALDDLVERLRLLKVWAGDPSYGAITTRVNQAWTAAGRPAADLTGKTTVVDCFRTGRRRVNADLVLAVVQALHPDVGYVSQWRQALQVVGGQVRAAAQVRVQDELPPDLGSFTGRKSELDLLRNASPFRTAGDDRGLVCVIAGMAGVGKTQFAFHAAHLLIQDGLAVGSSVDQVLFANLRGFDPDPAQPPAEPAAVLEGFLRLLGVPGHQIPHDLDSRVAAYRARLTGTRTLVMLDNVADHPQVAPLLPDARDSGCLVLITSRRALPALDPGLHLRLDVFDPGEAQDYLARATPGVPIGDDPQAVIRIAHRCGHLPLALGLVAAHIAAAPGWTLTDHADRLDERHSTRRLDTGVEAALDLSYRHLPTDRQRLLRLAALHPGQDLDAYAAAALTGTDRAGAQAHLDHLSRDHLLNQHTPGRYAFHDLVRAYAITRAGDQDSPPARRAALTCLFDYYLATSAAAMDTLYPGDTTTRPSIPDPGTPTPDLTDPDAALAWLNIERPTLTAVAAHAATDGWPTHAGRLSVTLFRYLVGHHDAASIIHEHALLAARGTGDLNAQAHALTNLGSLEVSLGRYGPAGDHLREALARFRRTGDRVGQTRPLSTLGVIEARQGRHRSAIEHFQQILRLCQQTGNVAGEARALTNLGINEARLGRYETALDHHRQGLDLTRQAGDQLGEAWALRTLALVETRLGRYEPAHEHLQEAGARYRQLGNRTGEAWMLDSLGHLQTLRGRLTQAGELHQQALTVFLETGLRDGHVSALNGLGEAAGRPAEAVKHHTHALTLATDTGDRDQQARAHAGLGRAHHTLEQPALAQHHYRHAQALYTDLGAPEANEIATVLATLEHGVHESR